MCVLSAHMVLEFKVCLLWVTLSHLWGVENSCDKVWREGGWGVFKDAGFMFAPHPPHLLWSQWFILKWMCNLFPPPPPLCCCVVLCSAGRPWHDAWQDVDRPAAVRRVPGLAVVRRLPALRPALGRRQWIIFNLLHHVVCAVSQKNWTLILKCNNVPTYTSKITQ